MFTNTLFNTIIPQREHARLAGNIALYWGNDDFGLPRIPMKSVVQGISFHQNGYELFDTNPVKKMPENKLLEVFQNDFAVNMDDGDAEIINMFHQHRLVSGIAAKEKSQKFKDLQAEFEKKIQLHLEHSKYKKEDFEWANRITHLCDKLSFNFCLNNNAEEFVPLYEAIDKKQTINSIHKLSQDGAVIELSPWPFATPVIKSTVISYEPEDYPTQLKPVILECVVIPKL